MSLIKAFIAAATTMGTVDNSGMGNTYHLTQKVIKWNQLII